VIINAAIMFDTDEDLVELVGRELAQMPTLALSCKPVSALELAGLVQLALRHPNVSPHVRDAGRAFIEGIREYFRAADALGAVELLRRGDDPAYDVVATKGTKPS
jgi:hypothetical protein